jgi:nucleotide-binding universal stress UspA family protein
METGESTSPASGAGVVDGGFARVVCGVDGRRMGFEAARQAARLTATSGRLTMVGVAQLFDALAERWGAEPPRRRGVLMGDRSAEDYMEDLRGRARRSLAWAESQVAGPAEVTTRVVDGEVHEGLLDVARREDAGLIAVGAHGGARMAGALLAEAASMVLHEARTSVLVARPSFDPGRFPLHVVVGVDGSPESRLALGTAAALRLRTGGALTVVTAGRDQDDAVAALGGFTTPHERVATRGRPVEALVAAALTADLTILGSRGLHGARALGSVSERVAFRAESSVLVVRPAREPS